MKPHVSEKAAYLADRGVYVFDVPLHANKVEIRKAVEALYKVNVTNVRTERGIGKIVRRGRVAGKRSDWKKALVEVQKGQSINLVEGV
ncbi:50S ribosomal protein L23 [Candidatus Uhrbacteria bacterium RIFCSPHIGHO2_12_FULL_60_25]|uniref:Large ribosomal subunit protein uL23 n=1 Tax=Candidatus Uhrbacteria bacterium RIFCSPHIGHO2_12_FULL_60_25 TaxID=1802399 RepID=A0A1F7UNH9_9BACT|nr:MAG: 50S ribosomal protein L23 [Candidatus Uhrbacteria bacterium RIFCSPHIGHO2_02_FULL_60_44]OGL79247.1 MAG: 50S ribosomal protein L23 [Candidatus Uhrbacteria bacterium RIFCSPHIGHO2_12_FULL_60_25]